MPPLARRAARALALLGALSAALVVACRPKSSVPADWRNQLQARASAATFGAERPPVRKDSSATPSPDLPAMTFARNAAPRDSVGIALRITSPAAYQRLGIAAGVNYLWVATGKPTRIAIVPADSSQAAHWLVVAPHTDPKMSMMCRQDPDAAELNIEVSGERGAPGAATTAALMEIFTTCTCVGGVWLHGGLLESEITQENAGPLFPDR